MIWNSDSFSLSYHLINNFVIHLRGIHRHSWFSSNDGVKKEMDDYLVHKYMKDNEMRIAIAETCGWRHFDLSPQQDYAWMKPTGETANKSDMPYYLNDLNAMHEVESLLTNTELDSMHEHLAHVMDTMNSQVNDRKHIWRSTARQHAEAFLRAKNLYKD